MAVPSSDATNLTMSAIDVPSAFAALYAHFNTTSTRWTPTDERATPAAPPGPDGSFSFTIQSVADPDIEINFCNNGTQAAPDLLDARVGINPTAQANPIADSRDPSASAPDYSGLNGTTYENGAEAFNWSRVNSRLAVPTSTQFILIEYDDAIIILFKNAARTVFVRGLHAGRIFVPNFTGWSSGAYGLDGLGVLGGAPQTVGNLDGRWAWFDSTRQSFPPTFDDNTSIFRQLAAGQTVGAASATAILGNAWVYGAGAIPNNRNNANMTVAGELNPSTVTFGLGFNTYGICKYLRLLPGETPYRVWDAIGTSTEVYMTIGESYTTTASPLACVIPDNFVPNP